MNKIMALYINEMIKISKKVSIVILAVILIVGVFGLGAMMKIQQNSMARYQDSGGMDQVWMIEEMERIQDDLRDQMADSKEQLAGLDAVQDAPFYQSLEETVADLQDQIDMYGTAIDKKIMLMEGNTYLSRSLYKTADIKRQLRMLQKTDQADRDAVWQETVERLEQQLAAYEAMIEQPRFETYLELETDSIRQDEAMDADEKQLQLEKLSLWQKIDSSGGTENRQAAYQIESVLNRYETIRRSLNEKVDYTSYTGIVPLTPDKYDELENQLAVLIYQVDQGFLTTQAQGSLASTALESMLGFGSFMVVLMALILAGGSISQELATGSIKSLIIAPVKRWKIFTAKVLSLVSISVLSMLVLFLVSQLSYGIFFGFSTGQPYVFAVNGQAGSISFTLFHLAGLFVRLIDVLVFMALALMLSVLTRNTAAAVGISMATYFGSSLAQQILMFLPAAEWIKFIPFRNIGLLDKFFPFRDTMSMNEFGGMFGGMGTQSQTSLTFSLIYLAVLLICMFYTALDSFNRRDIK